MNFEKLIKSLKLQPLKIEGGYFCRTYTNSITFGESKRSVGSAIYYLITEESFSAMHKLNSSDEMFHFYCGDSVEMLLLQENGHGEIVTISNQDENLNPQQLVPKGVWQGTRLIPSGRFALLGVTVTPAFEYEDFVLGNRDELMKKYPEYEDMIVALTKE